MGQPIRAPICCASRMAAWQKARTRSSSRIRSAVAPVSTDTGLMVMLPQSLYQTSAWIPADRVTSKPPVSRTAARARSRADSLWSGSPMISPAPRWWRTTPGSGTLQLKWTTPPMTCRTGIAAAICPPGSVLAR